MSDLTYQTAWFADVVQGHREVTDAIALDNGHVRVERRKVPGITVAPINTERIDRRTVEAIFKSGTPTVILLIPNQAHYDWSARKFAEENKSTIHTFKELYTSMRERDPRPFVDKNVSYAMQRLGQHNKVQAVDMICEASMRLKRHGDLGDVVVAVEYEYEFSEEAIVRALNRHPDIDVVLNSNPNGRPTGAARSHAEHAKTPIFRLTELMGALNYDGERFRTYQPPNTT